MKQSIAVIGAGVCGAMCARQLAESGHSVTVFDKGRGPGGRMSSRRTESGHRFDHGAARFEVSETSLHDSLAPAVATGVLHRSGNIYTSPTGLSALCKWLLDGLPAQYSTKWVRVERCTSWTGLDEAGKPNGLFDVVVLAVPPVNAVEAVIAYDPDLAETISTVRMLPRWVAMLAFSEKLSDVPDRSTVSGQMLRRSMSNSVGDALVVEASQDWSIEHVEQDAASVGSALHELVRPALPSAAPTSISAHRWRYAFADRPLGRPYLTGNDGLFVCGDWCLGHSVESAWLSASAVAGAVSQA